MSFEGMKKEELFKVAVEDFAVDVKPTDSKTSILAALEEDGVTWDMYLAQHPELAPEPPPEERNVVTAGAVTGKEPSVSVDAEAVAHPVIRTREEPVRGSTSDLYLIKMDRDNPYFEFRGYKFTQEHPYAIMPAAEADAILRTEEGFAIATPSEASEYYG